MDSIIVEDSGPLNGKIITIQDEDTKQLKKLRKNSRFAYSNEWG